MIWSWFVVGVLCVFLALLIITASIHLWYIPFVPTPYPIVRAMMGLAKIKRGEIVYDLGAGDARLLLIAKTKAPSIRAIGYEVAPLVWMLGELKIFLSSKKVDLRFQNIFRANLQDADVIFLYLSTELMESLRPKFDRELKPGTRVVSHVFQFHDRRPKKVETVKLKFWGKKRIFLYVW